MTQTTISLPPPTPRYAIARKSAGGIEVAGYTHATTALEALRAVSRAGFDSRYGVIPWKALNASQRAIALCKFISGSAA